MEIVTHESMIEKAQTLAKFIQEKKLTTTIQGKEFVQVDGWQFAGSQLGVVPVLTSLENFSEGTEYKYRAEVDLIRLSDGLKVGKGIAICSNKERTKKSFEEYAIASMAQTRAEGKAFRMLCSWLIKAAGFDTTPAEEADYEREDVPGEGDKAVLRKLVGSSTLDEEKKTEAYATIEGCTTYPLYQKIQYRLESLQQGYNDVPNPSQKDINKHLKKSIA